MAELFTLSATDLAALLCSRVCHDIISPVGAINNGLELLDEGGADEDAMNLIRQSARNASARLQFARIAFGAAGSAGMLIDTGDAEAVAAAFLKNEKPELTWTGNRALLPKNKVKLLLNLQQVEKVAYLFITHDLATVKSIADSIAVMYRGEVVRYGSKSKVLTPPFDAYTELLLSSVPEMEIGWLEKAIKGRRMASAGN